MNNQSFYVVFTGEHAVIYDSLPEEAGNSMRFPNWQQAQSAWKSADPTAGIIEPAISVDSDCNYTTGCCSYRGINTRTKELLFSMGPYQEDSNNIAYFLPLFTRWRGVKKRICHGRFIQAA